MTTGTIIFLTLIAALVLVLGVAVIWQSCNIRGSIDKSVKGCRNTIDSGYNNEAKYVLYGFEKELNHKSESISKSGLSPESTTPKGTITPPSSFSDIELRKYCIEQTRKDQVYLRIEDAQRLYDYILNGNQRGKEVTNEH